MFAQVSATYGGRMQKYNLLALSPVPSDSPDSDDRESAAASVTPVYDALVRDWRAKGRPLPVTFESSAA